MGLYDKSDAGRDGLIPGLVCRCCAGHLGVTHKNSKCLIEVALLQFAKHLLGNSNILNADSLLYPQNNSLDNAN
jgi:hypothetical protein